VKYLVTIRVRHWLDIGQSRLGFPGFANYFPVTKALPEPPKIRYPAARTGSVAAGRAAAPHPANSTTRCGADGSGSHSCPLLTGVQVTTGPAQGVRDLRWRRRAGGRHDPVRPPGNGIFGGSGGFGDRE